MGGDSESRQIRCTPDWSENAIAGDHLWIPTSVSGDCCYIGDGDCTVSLFYFINAININTSALYIFIFIVNMNNKIEF